MIGIIGAMDEEVAMLKEKLTEVQVETKAAMDFYKGKLEGKDVVVVRSGIGKVNAGICSQILVDLYQVDGIVNQHWYCRFLKGRDQHWGYRAVYRCITA